MNQARQLVFQETFRLLLPIEKPLLALVIKALDVQAHDVQIRSVHFKTFYKFNFFNFQILTKI